MRTLLGALGGLLLGVLTTLAVHEVWAILARLDRIERYLAQVSQLLRG